MRKAIAAALCLLLCAAASAQERRPALVGVLEVGSAGSFPDRTRAFREGLRERGYVEGRDVVLEHRFAGGRMAEVPRLAAELVSLKPDVIFAPATVTALAAIKATSTIPVVFAVPGDPIGVGLVASLGRPGGNATGLTTGNVEIAPKRLELLKRISGASAIGALFNPEDPSNVLYIRTVEDAASRLSVRVHPIPVRTAGDLRAAFSALPEHGLRAVLVAAGAMMDGNRARIAELAARSGVPALYGAPEFVRAGGLASYSASFTDNYRRAAGHVDRILRGAKPAELPVEQANRFELLVNVRAANALGITVPADVLVQASELIE